MSRAVEKMKERKAGETTSTGSRKREKMKIPCGAPLKMTDEKGLLIIYVITPATRKYLRADILAKEEEYDKEHERGSNVFLSTSPGDSDSKEKEKVASEEPHKEVKVNEDRGDVIVNKVNDKIDDEVVEEVIDEIDDEMTGEKIDIWIRQTGSYSGRNFKAVKKRLKLADVKERASMNYSPSGKKEDCQEFIDNSLRYKLSMPPTEAIRSWTMVPYCDRRKDSADRDKDCAETPKLTPTDEEVRKLTYTELCCWNDTEPINGIPFPMPWRKQGSTGKYYVFGLFCCPGCARKYNRETSTTSCISMRDLLIMEMARKYYGYIQSKLRSFPLAADRRALKKFGGILDIVEYRRLAGYRSDTRIEILLPLEMLPMTFVERAVQNSRYEVDTGVATTADIPKKATKPSAEAYEKKNEKKKPLKKTPDAKKVLDPTKKKMIDDTNVMFVNLTVPLVKAKDPAKKGKRKGSKQSKTDWRDAAANLSPGVVENPKDEKTLRSPSKTLRSPSEILRSPSSRLGTENIISLVHTMKAQKALSRV